MVIDKTELFAGRTKRNVQRNELRAGIERRNVLRKEVGLPLLDVEIELAHEMALADENDFHAFAVEHGAERLMIREQVIADLREQHGKDFGYTMGGRWAINHETNKRFKAHLLAVYNLETPPLADSHPVIYGEGEPDAAV
jgi:hypothetical protein